MKDEITLTLPRLRPFYGIAHLVLGGLAVRLDLTFEHLEDLQLALEGLLDRADDEGDVTVRVHVDGDVLRATVGPFDRAALEDRLQRTGEEEMGLRRLLDTVVDGVEVAEQDEGTWVELTKTVAAGGRG
jgi:anti-sigma regulatory factor (Ser/Thr protein kinase)